MIHKDALRNWLLDGTNSSFLQEMVDNLLSYAEKHENNSKDQFVYFLHDILPDKISFGQIAQFVDDESLTSNGQYEKYQTLIEFRPGYYEWIFTYQGKVIYTYLAELEDVAPENCSPSELSEIVDMYIEAMSLDLQEKGVITLCELAKQVLHEKMVNAWAAYFCVDLASQNHE